MYDDFDVKLWLLNLLTLLRHYIYYYLLHYMVTGYITFIGSVTSCVCDVLAAKYLWRSKIKAMVSFVNIAMIFLSQIVVKYQYTS